MTTKSRPKKGRTLEEWKEVIEDWQQSGLSHFAYCREKHLSQSVFYEWKHKVDLAFYKEDYMKTFQNWEGIIKDWEQSGLSKNAYCRGKDIEYFAFYAWEKKINQTHEVKKAETLQKWESILQDWEKSNLHISVYCKENNLTISSFNKWKKQLRPFLGRDSYIKALQKWEFHIEEWKKSGLNRNTYCKQKSLHCPSFYTWEKKLNPSRKPHQIEVLEKWTPIVEDWEKSGLSKHAYCIDKELTSSFFYQAQKMKPSDPTKTRHCIALKKWKAIMADWKKSGLNRWNYCKKNGLPNSSFYTWEKKLTPSRSSAKSIKEPPTMSEISPQDFLIPFALNATIANTSPSSPPKVEITLAQGHRLILEGIFEWEKLASWLAPLLTQEH